MSILAPAFRKARLAALLLAGLVAAAGPAAAAPESLREGLFGYHPREMGHLDLPTARYVSEDGDGFVVDRSQGRVLLKFDDSFEVWVLQAQPAPRGDVIYRNDLGEPMLRATRLGGVTLFTDQRPYGAPAALTGGAPPLRLAPVSPQGLLERLAQASARASRAARRLIPFDAEASPSSSALVGDAAMVTAEAIIRVSRGGSRETLARLVKVELVEGRKAAAAMGHAGVLRVTVAPAHGLAGRPSSERIAAVAAGGRR